MLRPGFESSMEHGCKLVCKFIGDKADWWWSTPKKYGRKKSAVVVVVKSKVPAVEEKNLVLFIISNLYERTDLTFVVSFEVY